MIPAVLAALCQSLTANQASKPSSDIGGQLICLGELPIQIRLQGCEALGKRHFVFFDTCCADIPPGGQHVAVGLDLIETRRLAETGHIHVRISAALTSPSMIGAGNFLDVPAGKFLSRAVDHMTELARVDEQDLTAPVPQLDVAGNAIRPVAGEKPQADRYLRRIEKLAR